MNSNSTLILRKFKLVWRTISENLMMIQDNFKEINNKMMIMMNNASQTNILINTIIN